MYDPQILDIQQKLLLLENSKPVSTASELCAVRCIFCGDSMNLRSAHLYIGVKEINGQEVLMYDCKKCGQSGAITPTIMHRLGIHDISVDEYLKGTRNNKYIRNFENEKDTSRIQYKYPKPTANDAEKVAYLTERLQIDFSDYENIKKYKVVLNFGKFLRDNHIENPQCNPSKIPLLSDYAIGFIGESKTVISLRSMDPNITGSRFNIIHLYKTQRRIPFLYMPPCTVDVLTPFPKIVISESNFNITCVKNYFYGDDCTNVMFGSSSRKGCLYAIKRLMALSGFVSGDIEVYADNDDDFSPEYFDKLLAPLKATFNISIIINTKDKDFGVMPKAGETFEYKTFHL